MSKSALVVDTPKNCHSCKFLAYIGNSWYCDITHYIVYEVTSKSPHCPLKRLTDDLIMQEDETVTTYRLRVPK